VRCRADRYNIRHAADVVPRIIDHRELASHTEVA
jgi:hypothetical protein